MKLTTIGSLKEVNEVMGMVGSNKKLKPSNVTLQGNEDQTEYTLEIFFEKESIKNVTDSVSVKTKYAIKCYEDGKFKGYYLQFNTSGIDVVPMKEVAVIEEGTIAKKRLKTLNEIYEIKPNSNHHFEIEEF